jgi:hypothetical protein
MKGITFAIAFILTTCIVIGGVAIYPKVLGQAAVYNNEFVFGFFLGPFLVLLFFAWVGEKIFLKLKKTKE